MQPRSQLVTLDFLELSGTPDRPWVTFVRAYLPILLSMFKWSPVVGYLPGIHAHQEVAKDRPDVVAAVVLLLFAQSACVQAEWAKHRIKRGMTAAQAASFYLMIMEQPGRSRTGASSRGPISSI
jgi:hypothetical protein